MAATYVEQQIDNGKAVTESAVLTDIQDGNMDCLYFATEGHIDSLIEKGKISEDVASQHQDHQEEMRGMMADANIEFAAYFKSL